MNNYYYIIAGLPELSMDAVSGEKNADDLIDEIKGQCSGADLSVISLLEKGYVAENLNADFYREALSGKNGFLRNWFAFDLNVRNAKVRYLNNALGREKSQDTISLSDEENSEEFEEAAKLASILSGDDIIARERGIDDLYWEKADELTLFHYFDLTAILGFIVKLKIIDRWMKLDESTGREMFRRLVDDVRGTFKGVEFNG